MKTRPLFTKNQYLKKIINTFFPKLLFKLSPLRKTGQDHWKKQKAGDIHGYDKYLVMTPRVTTLMNEVQLRASKTDSILDLGCNCGFYLWNLKKTGYVNLAGIDICENALEFGRKELDLSGIELIAGSFEEVLPRMEQVDKQYDLVYSMGATLELVHPSFDIIHAICSISRRFVVLGISEWGHSYPRFWEYEFNRNGFIMVKCIRPFTADGPVTDPSESDALLVFQRVAS
jgi:SAM-dependent methyltransferase